MGTTQQPNDTPNPRGSSVTQHLSGSLLSRIVGATLLLGSMLGHILNGVEPHMGLLGVGLIALTGRDGIEFVKLIKGGGPS